MQNNLKQALQGCNVTCQELSTLLENENDHLQKRKNIGKVEENIKTKKHLTLQLEKFINVIKTNFEVIRTSQEMAKDLNIFKRLIETYKSLVERNALLLKAAHSATSMILDTIQKQTTRAPVKTYNAYGNVEIKQDRGPSLINYSV